jgi:hypothetical protein
VNTDQLIESLSGNAPDPDHVLASFGRKRRAARNRMYAVSGGLAAAVVAVVAGILLQGAGTGGVSTADSSPANGIAAPAATAPQNGLASGVRSQSGAAASSAANCGTVWLRAELVQAVRNGASVIVGYGTLASDGTAVQGAAKNAPSYSSVTLRSVQTLAGPTVTSGSIAWITGPGQPSPSAGGSSGPASVAALPPTFGPRDELFGIVSPSGSSGAPGPVLRAALVDNGQVLLSGAGCWDVTASGSQLSPAYGGVHSVPARSGARLTTEVPLATAEKLAAQSR